MKSYADTPDDEGLYRNSQSKNPISNVHIYAQTETILHLPAISLAYHEELRKLMFDPDNMPPLNEVINAITLLQNPLKRFDERYRM